MARVAVNEYTDLLGTSGSSRATRSVVAALRENYDVSTLRPASIPNGGLPKALHMAYWDLVGAGRKAKSAGQSIIVNSANSGRGAAGLPSVLVMYDTMVLDHPKLFDARFAAYASFVYPMSARSATTIVTCSEHSARRISARWPKADVRVHPWPVVTPVLPPSSLREPYVLVVSSLDKHKRVSMAIDAVERTRTHLKDLKLVIVFRAGNDSSSVAARVAQANADITWIDCVRDVPEDRLHELYRHAVCTLVASYDEGYCLPAVESTAAGTPVAHTGRGALVEVAPRVAPASGPLSRDQEIEWLAEQVTASAVGDAISRDWYEAARLRLEEASAASFAAFWKRTTDDALR